jgi:hypothetical protein
VSLRRSILREIESTYFQGIVGIALKDNEMYRSQTFRYVGAYKATFRIVQIFSATCAILTAFGIFALIYSLKM